MRAVFTIAGIALLGIIVTVWISVYGRKKKIVRNRHDVIEGLPDAEIINSIPFDIKHKYEIPNVDSGFVLTSEWLANEIFMSVLCCDSDSMDRICSHIIGVSNGKYRVAAKIGDKFNASCMVETEIVSGDHFVKKIKMRGIVENFSGQVLLKAIVG